MGEWIQCKFLNAKHPDNDYGGNKRSRNYDYLRVFAMFMVILNHVADHYFVALEEPPIIVYIYEGISHCAVPLFLMLTGVFVINKAGKTSPKAFYLDSVKKLGIPLVLYATIYYIFELWTGSITPMHILQTIVTGFCGVYAHWYVIMLATVYAFLPLVAFIKKHVAYEKYEKGVIIIFIWLMVGHYYESGYTSWSLANLYYMGYVLIGDVIAARLKNTKNNLPGVLLILLAIVLLACNHALVYASAYAGNEFVHNLLNNYYSSPLIVIASLLIFAGFSILEVKRNLSLLAKTSYSVFLSHKLILTILLWYTDISTVVEEMLNWNLLLIIPIGVIVVFVVSFAVSLVIDFILERSIYKLRKL